MLGKILLTVLGAFTSQGTVVNKAVGVTNAAVWLALIPVAGYAWHYRNEIVTFQASVGTIVTAVGIGWAFISTIIAVAQKSSPTPPQYYPPTSRAE